MVIAVHQPPGEVAANEAKAAGDQDIHVAGAEVGFLARTTRSR
jgi:hypothetical protein